MKYPWYRSYALFKIHLKYRLIIRKNFYSRREPQKFRDLYLGRPPVRDHPLSFLWNVDPRSMTRWILHGEVMLAIWDLLLEKQPMNIFEFGSGWSTAALGKYAEYMEKTRAKRPFVISIEHDEKWASATQTIMEDFGLRRYSRVHICPLIERVINGDQGMIYDLSPVDIRSIDFLLIDGPPSTVGRNLTLPAVLSKIEPGSYVVMDDLGRNQEHQAIKHWCDKYRERIRLAGYVPAGKGIGCLISEPGKSA
jgi:hypothetical protein